MSVEIQTWLLMLVQRVFLPAISPVHSSIVNSDSTMDGLCSLIQCTSNLIFAYSNQAIEAKLKLLKSYLLVKGSTCGFGVVPWGPCIKDMLCQLGNVGNG